jgi:hypothetical protein
MLMIASNCGHSKTSNTIFHAPLQYGAEIYEVVSNVPTEMMELRAKIGRSGR